MLPVDDWCSLPPPSSLLPLQAFSDAELKAASSLLDSEVAFVIKAMDHSAVSQETYMETWASVHRDFIWVPSKGRYERAASATNTERVESVKVRKLRRGGRLSSDVGKCVGSRKYESLRAVWFQAACPEPPCKARGVRGGG